MSASPPKPEPPSHALRYTEAPLVKSTYAPADALADLPGITYALDLFLASQMVESEEFCAKSDPNMERLYFATGFGLIQCVKALMSYADEDILAAMGHVKRGNAIANKHRKPVPFLTSRLAGYVVSSLNTTGVGFIKSMTPVERHAELVYAESLYEKALLGIVYSGDWLAFLKEALNMRTMINIYRELGKFVETMDEEAVARGEGPEDKTIDPDFRSGVYLGVGMSNLVLSMMPSKLLTIVEFFGYKGDRHLSLQLLMKAGGWSKDSPTPTIGTAEEGVRRTMCDMALLIFHLVLSSFTFDGVDVKMAQKILDWNLKRYPNGVFFLFGAGRLSLIRSQPKRALTFYKRAMAVQSQYRNLHHVSFWEMSITNLALWDIPASLVCWRDLATEATWSKSTYTYGTAVCLLEIGGEANVKEAAALMEKVPTLRQRIAGKSIPLEKFVARKARKFQQQQRRLLLPALEVAYIFHAIAHAPRTVIAERMLPAAEAALAALATHSADPAKYPGGGFWDDLCLAHFLAGVCLRYIAYPDPDAELDPDEPVGLTRADAEARAVASFEAVFVNGPRILLDHHLVYHAHYELGRLLVCRGDTDGARAQFDLVLSGKPLEVNAAGRKGKYSMESALLMRTHAAVEALQNV